MLEKDINVGDVIERQENAGFCQEYLILDKQAVYAVTMRLTEKRAGSNENPVMVGCRVGDAGRIGYVHYNEMLRVSWHIKHCDLTQVKNKVVKAIGLDDVLDADTRIKELKEKLELKQAIISSLNADNQRLRDNVDYYRTVLGNMQAQKPKRRFFTFLFGRRSA